MTTNYSAVQSPLSLIRVYCVTVTHILNLEILKTSKIIIGHNDMADHTANPPPRSNIRPQATLRQMETYRRRANKIRIYPGMMNRIRVLNWFLVTGRQSVC